MSGVRSIITSEAGGDYPMMPDELSGNCHCAAEVCEFLSEYSVLLFGSGATCIRMEKNVIRMAARLGMRIAISIMPRHIHLTIFDDRTGESATSVSAIREMPINFKKIALLSKLSWELADGQIDFQEAKRRVEKIARFKGLDFKFVLPLVACANAAFCRLFNGDFSAMGIVFAATLLGFSLKHLLGRLHVDFRLIVLLCSLVSTLTAAGGVLLFPGATPGVAVGTSVLYLVPGIPFINSFCDMIDRHYICAFGRLMNAIVILCCLSLGLCVGMWLMHEGMF